MRCLLAPQRVAAGRKHGSKKFKHLLHVLMNKSQVLGSKPWLTRGKPVETRGNPSEYYVLLQTPVSLTRGNPWKTRSKPVEKRGKDMGRGL